MKRAGPSPLVATALGVICAVCGGAATLLPRVAVAGQGDELVGQRLKVTGRWTDGRLDAIRVQYRDPQHDTAAGRVGGRIGAVGPEPGTLRVGPLVVVRGPATQLDGLTDADLVVGRSVEAIGRVVAPGRLEADTIVARRDVGPIVEILGAVTAEEVTPDGGRSLVVLGVPVVVPATVAIGEVGLTRSLDERRPLDQLTVPVLGRPLTIGGQLETDSRYTHGRKLGPDDQVRENLEFKPELTWTLGPHTILFLQAKALYEDKIDPADTSREYLLALERAETWLYAGDLGGTGLGLQVGRQNFREQREWWWDRDLDAVRVYYERPRLHLELGVGEELLAVSTDKGTVDPEFDGVLRVIGSGAWAWRDKQRLDVFALYQRDGSGRPPLGKFVDDGSLDKSDADLTWLGGRTSGELGTGGFGDLEYVADGAWVGGRERLVAFGDKTGGQKPVTGLTSRNVGGFAFDGRSTWRLPLGWRPAFTLGYAFGSGDSGTGGTDHAFRQTGLQRNKDRFRGVDRFAVYGALLRPELSNLHIVTAAFGFRFLTASSAELVYHFYHQVTPADFLRDSDISADPEGGNGSIGQEWDLVLGMREWQRVDLELIGALFRAGPAYGAQAGSLAEGIFLKVRYNF